MALEHEVVLDLEEISTSFVLILLRVTTIRTPKVIRSIVLTYKFVQLWGDKLYILGIKKAHERQIPLEPY